MKRAAFLFCCFSIGHLYTQNLIANPSFETYSHCPYALGSFADHAVDWSTPTAGSPDYFNTCSKVMGVPKNFIGAQEPHHGNAYAGFYFYAPSDYREYIQAKLNRTLKKGVEYDFSFYVSLAEGSDYAVKDFGVVLSSRKLQTPIKKTLSKGLLYKTKNQFHVFEITHDHLDHNTQNWLKIQGTFMAKGFENYVSIGNLRDNKSTKKEQVKRTKTKKGAYYYIDQIHLAPHNTKTNVVLNMDTPHFDQIHFNHDSFALDSTAKHKIKATFDYLAAHPKLLLTIHAHADGSGTLGYNQKLSEQRARAIMAYFLTLGLAQERMDYRAHSSRVPVAPNDNNTGRQLNRRATFEIRQAVD